jgi:hypothetical protein
MKPMLAPAFRKKVKMIPEQDLHRYLQEGYQTYLPDAMESGKANTDDLVEDFVTYRKYLDELNPNYVENDKSSENNSVVTWSRDDQTLSP